MLADVGVPEAPSVGEGQTKLWRTSRQWPERPWGSQAKTGQDFLGHGGVRGESHHAHAPVAAGTQQDGGAKGALKELRP